MANQVKQAALSKADAETLANGICPGCNYNRFIVRQSDHDFVCLRCFAIYKLYAPSAVTIQAYSRGFLSPEQAWANLNITTGRLV